VSGACGCEKTKKHVVINVFIKTKDKCVHKNGNCLHAEILNRASSLFRIGVMYMANSNYSLVVGQAIRVVKMMRVSNTTHLTRERQPIATAVNKDVNKTSGSLNANILHLRDTRAEL